MTRRCGSNPRPAILAQHPYPTPAYQVEWIDLAAPEQGWHIGASLPTPRAGNALAVDGAAGVLMILGGETDHNTPEGGELTQACDL